jgi:hypothetical protein
MFPWTVRENTGPTGKNSFFKAEGALWGVAPTDPPGKPQTVREITHLGFSKMFWWTVPADRPVFSRTI